MPTLKEMVTTFKITPDANGKSKALTDEFRSSYAFVYKPYDNQKDEPKHSIQMIFDKKNTKALKPLVQAAANACARKWGAIGNWPKMKNNLFKLAVEEEEATEKHYKDTIVITARSAKDKPPGIVGPNAKPYMDGEEHFYSGCEGRATIVAYAYDHAQNKGVAFGLNNLMFVRDNERLDGQSSAEDDFGEYATDEVEDETETDSADESGF